MYYVHPGESRGLSRWIFIITLLIFGFASQLELTAQGSANDLGNGGRHIIQGRLYVSNGQRSQVAGLRIRLTSSATSDISLVSDDSGTFTFRGVNPGSYTVTIEGGGIFEDVSESVLLDDPGSSNIRNTVRMRAAPRTVNVQIYLRPKVSPQAVSRPAAVIDAKWAAVPKEAIENYERGLRLAQDGNDREAAVAFKRAIEVSPSFAPAHTALGRIAQRAGNLDASIESWKTAVRYNAQDFDAHLNLGIAYLNLKKYGEAETALVAAAFLEPSAVTPHYYLGIAFVVKNDLDVAVKAFEKAKELNGGKALPAIHKYLGRIYGAKNRPKEAVEELETYLRLAPDAQDVEKVRKDISDIKSRQN
jgi:Tfp pilus assembly protein PilF